MVKVVIVFHSGAIIEIDADENKADTLLGDFYSDWDKPGVVLNGELNKGGGSPYRIKATDVSGIMVR